MAANATQTFPLEFVEGDRLPEIGGVIDGTDITGYAITLHLKRPGTTVLTIPATILDAPAGRFKFPWGVGDLVAGNGQEAEVQVVNGASLPETSPKFLLNVRKQIA